MFNADIPLMTLAYIAALAAVFTILIYCAWNKQPELDYEGADIARNDAAAVPDAAIATNFQLLSLFPNVTFGIAGFVVIPLLNVIGFLIGNVVTACSLARLLQAIQQYRTPHNYIASVHNTAWLRKFTAWISFSVFTAVTAFEIVYLSRISKSLLGGSDASYFFLVAMLTIAMILIAVVGHQRGTLEADRWLLLIAYVGLHLATGYLLSLVSVQVLDMTSFIVILFLMLMVYYRLLRFKDRTARSRWRHVVVLLSSLSLLAAIIFYKGISSQWSVSTFTLATAVFSPAGNGLSLRVFALAAVASCGPVIFYNFVDFSFWQKYLSEVRDSEPIAAFTKRVRKPFWTYVWESPLSWLLPVAMGIYAVNLISQAASESNPIGGIIELFASQSTFGAGVAVVLFASLVAIATSTACGYLVSTSQLIHADILDRDWQSDRSPLPLFLMGAVMLFILVPVDMLVHSTDRIIVLMLTCFAPLCALTPLVIWPLYRGRVYLSSSGGKGVFAALSLASAAGIFVGAIAALKNASPTEFLFWASLPASLASGWALYLVAIMFGAAKPSPTS
jgi:Na+/proline symporter